MESVDVQAAALKEILKNDLLDQEGVTYTAEVVDGVLTITEQKE